MPSNLLEVFFFEVAFPDRFVLAFLLKGSFPKTGNFGWWFKRSLTFHHPPRVIYREDSRFKKSPFDEELIYLSRWKQELPLGQLQSQAFLYTWLKQIPSGLALVLTLSGKLLRHEGSIPHLIPPLFTVPPCSSQIRSFAVIFTCLLGLDCEGNSLV